MPVQSEKASDEIVCVVYVIVNAGNSNGRKKGVRRAANEGRVQVGESMATQELNSSNAAPFELRLILGILHAVATETCYSKQRILKFLELVGDSMITCNQSVCMLPTFHTSAGSIKDLPCCHLKPVISNYAENGINGRAGARKRSESRISYFISPNKQARNKAT